jgi:hypothetical protein
MTDTAASVYPISILDALDDAALFAPHFRGGTWKPWRAFLAALFGLPLSEPERGIFAACTGRTTPPDEQFREAALIVGRRGGKSRALALIAVYLATFRSYGEYLAPGEVATIAVLAANRAQARSIFRFVSGMLKETPLLAPLVKEENTEAITLTNRVAIEISTASFRTTRGYSFAAVLCDEIAFWRQDETSANPDVEILRALRPGMATIPGSILLLASSPYAKRGELYSAYRKFHGNDSGRVLVWKADTATMNPAIDPAIIAEAYKDDPEAARAEYGAEFRDDLADFVTREVVDRVTMWGRSELPPEAGISYFAFCDPSGGASDAMTLAISHLSSDNVPVLDAVRETRPPFDPEGVVTEFAELLRRYGVDSVTGDRYGGEWPRQRFREHGIRYEPSARPKSDLYIDLLSLLNAARVELLDVPRLGAQLVGLERRTARSGRDSVDHTPGGHDDLANAVAGALVQIDIDRRPQLIKPAALMREGVACPMPRRADYVFGTLIVGLDGMAGAACFTRNTLVKPELLLADFISEPVDGGTIGRVVERLKQIAGGLGCPCETIVLFVQPALVRACRVQALDVSEIPPQVIEDIDDLAIRSASQVHLGRVGISAVAAEKSRTLPLGGALSFRVGTGRIADDALRVAVLAGIACAFEEHRPRPYSREWVNL